MCSVFITEQLNNMWQFYCNNIEFFRTTKKIIKNKTSKYIENSKIKVQSFFDFLNKKAANNKYISIIFLSVLEIKNSILAP